MAVKTFTQGEKLTAADTNLYLRNGVVAIFNETQAAGTQGGTNVLNTWTKRTLNTTLLNEISGCSVSSSVVTLPAGKYLCRAFAPFVFTGTTKIRLRNTSDGTTTLVGSGTYSAAGAGVYAAIDGYFSISATKNFEIQYYTGVVQATYGLGIASGSDSEIFTTVVFQQIGV